MTKIMRSSLPKIAYILWKFPKYTETFILDEMFFLRNEYPGLDLLLYSVKKVTKQVAHKKVAQFCDPGIYLPALFSPFLLSKVVLYILQHPRCVLKTVGKLMKEIPFRISLKLSVYYIIQSLYCSLKGIYIASELKGKGTGHLHTHFAESSGLITCIVSALTGIPYSLTLHRHDIFDNPNVNLIKMLIGNSAFSVSISQYNKDYLVGLDRSLEDKIAVIHCGIDLTLFESDKKAERRGTEKFRIVTVAHLVRRKGVHDLIEACAALPSQLDYECCIIGEGPERARLEDQVASYGLRDKILFKGAVSQREVFEQLRGATVFVLAAYSEGIPVSLMEAMAMQVPVISTRITGIPELVRDDTGILLEPGNVEELRSALQQMCHLTEQRKKEMGERALRIVSEEFNIRKQVKRLMNLFSRSANTSNKEIQ